MERQLKVRDTRGRASSWAQEISTCFNTYFFYFFFFPIPLSSAPFPSVDIFFFSFFSGRQILKCSRWVTPTSLSICRVLECWPLLNTTGRMDGRTEPDATIWMMGRWGLQVDARALLSAFKLFFLYHWASSSESIEVIPKQRLLLLLHEENMNTLWMSEATAWEGRMKERKKKILINFDNRLLHSRLDSASIFPSSSSSSSGLWSRSSFLLPLMARNGFILGNNNFFFLPLRFTSIYMNIFLYLASKSWAHRPSPPSFNDCYI